MNGINTVIAGKYKECKIVDCDINVNGKYYYWERKDLTAYTVIDIAASFSYGGAQLDMEYVIEVKWKEGGKSLIYIDRYNYLNFLRRVHS